MAGVFTYARSVRHLRPSQIYGRLRFRLARPKPDFSEAPPLRNTHATWIAPARRQASLVGPTRFRLLNEEHELDGCGWDDARLPLLWRYNLHYFDDLTAHDAGARVAWHRALLARWTRENPAGKGPGWAPYPTSLRVVNWIKWKLAGNTLPPECVHSLAVQVRWLGRRLETHLRGNHLFANAKALVFAGLAFDGPEAARWLAKGMRILDRELPEQILADGGQFERSTMYHALALEDLLDLWNVITAFSGAVPAQWRPAIERWRLAVGPMREWLRAMCHPDGELSFFNDAAKGIAPAPEELDAYACRLGFPPPDPPASGLTVLATSGYVRLQCAAAVAILDVAPVGPDYLPAHAHADTLSFELSLFGRRVLVNSGTSLYGNDAERLRQRGTAAHNTIMINGRDSTEVWSGFRVGRRARPVGLRANSGDTLVVRCGHDGYRNLAGKPRHWRTWQLTSGELLVMDEIDGAVTSAEARLHLHPDVRIAPHRPEAAATTVRLDLPDGRGLDLSVEGGSLRVEASTWHSEFGRAEPTLCLVAALDGATLRTRLRWAATA